MTFMPSTRSTDSSPINGRLDASSLLMFRVPLLIGCLSGGNVCTVKSLGRWWVRLQMFHGCVKLVARRINRTIEVAKLQVLP